MNSSFWIVVALVIIGIIAIVSLILVSILWSKSSSSINSIRVSATASQRIQDSNRTVLEFQRIDFSSGNINFSSPSYIKINSPGVYTIGANVYWDDSSQGSSSLRMLELVKISGSQNIYLDTNTISSSPGFSSSQSVSTVDYAKQGDIYYVQATQTSGGPIDIVSSQYGSPSLWAKQ